MKLTLGVSDLAQIRFVVSPLWEVVTSFRALEDPGRHAVHLPWLQKARPALRGLDLTLLRLLISPERPTGSTYIPDFIAPPPSDPFPDMDSELNRVLRTPPDVVRREARTFLRFSGIPPDRVSTLLDDPIDGMRALVDVMREYWRRVLAPDWPRMRALLQGEILQRARRLALEGAEALFTELHPELAYEGGGVLRFEKDCTDYEAGGRGLLLIPSVFTWPDLFLVANEPWPPSVMYPARGVASLWLSDAERGATHPDVVALGPARARILHALAEPVSTTELASRLGVTPGAVSQHLNALARDGLATGHRVGRSVIYERTEEGDRLGRSLVRGRADAAETAP